MSKYKVGDEVYFISCGAIESDEIKSIGRLYFFLDDHINKIVHKNAVFQTREEAIAMINKMCDEVGL